MGLHTKLLHQTATLIITTILIGTILPKVDCRLNVRKNSKDLTREEWAELRHGVELMKVRSYKDKYDPLGWYFQANIHGWAEFDGSADARREADHWNWHRCQHGHYYFLPWHRMYLYFFERIMRKLTGNKRLTIPYWDYFDPEERALPQPFRLPADTRQNPLYVRERCAALNAGMPLREEIVDPHPALNTTFFSVDDTVSRYHVCHSFGGARSRPKLVADRQGLLERIPHDYIHMFVGGPSGYMSDECRTARDPIFWLHHSQIDRVWESWREAGGGPGDGYKQYLNQSFEFYDEHGKRRAYKVRNFLNVTALGYRYDRLLPSERKPRKNGTKIPEVFVTARQTNFAKLAIDTDQQSVLMDLESTGADLFESIAKHPGNYTGLRFSLQVNFNYIDSTLIYNMHMNLPNGTHPYENRPYFFGSLVYFQANCIPTLRRELLDVKKCFDVTENLMLIIKRNYQYDGEFTKHINITFVPKACDDILLTGDSLKNARLPSSEKTMIRFNEIHLLHYFKD